MKLLLSVAVLFFIVGCVNKTNEAGVLHQVSPAKALFDGDYGGKLSYKKVRSLGDFGIGTYDHINGEMVALDGRFYQITSDGEISIAGDEQTTPYASVHFFSKDKGFVLQGSNGYKGLQAQLDEHITNPNLIHAFKIGATCKHIKVRSPKKQSKPYPKIKQVLAGQSIFNGESVKGHLIGYYSPKTVDSVIFPGYHFHFISDDGKLGGHVLDVSIDEANVEMDVIDKIQTYLF